MGEDGGVFAGNILYTHFCKERHDGLKDVPKQIIDITYESEPTGMEAYQTENLKCYVSLGLNVMEIQELCKFRDLVSIKDGGVLSDILEEMMKETDLETYF